MKIQYFTSTKIANICTHFSENTVLYSYKHYRYLYTFQWKYGILQLQSLDTVTIFRMNIPVYTTCRQEIPRRMKRRRHLIIIKCAEIERLTGFTVKQIKLCLLKAKLDTFGEKRVLVQRLYLHLHLHLHLELPAPSPTLQVTTSPTTWPAPAPLQHHLTSPPTRTTS